MGSSVLFLLLPAFITSLCWKQERELSLPDPYTGQLHCYRPVDVALDWYEAQEYCGQFGIFDWFQQPRLGPDVLDGDHVNLLPFKSVFRNRSASVDRWVGTASVWETATGFQRRVVEGDPEYDEGGVEECFYVHLPNGTKQIRRLTGATVEVKKAPCRGAKKQFVCIRTELQLLLILFAFFILLVVVFAVFAAGYCIVRLAKSPLRRRVPLGGRKGSVDPSLAGTEDPENYLLSDELLRAVLEKESLPHNRRWAVGPTVVEEDPHHRTHPLPKKKTGIGRPRETIDTRSFSVPTPPPAAAAPTSSASEGPGKLTPPTARSPSPSTSESSGLVAQGSYGKVYRVQCQGRVIAMKVLERVPNMDRVRREINTLKTLSHRNIIGYIGSEIRELDRIGVEKRVVIYTDFAEEGRVDEFVRRLCPDVFMRPRVAPALFRDFIQGLAFLHRNKVVHRDIKPGNILVQEEEGYFVVKIADFGCAKFLKVTARSASMSMFGTLTYSPPEFLVEDGPDCDKPSSGRSRSRSRSRGPGEVKHNVASADVWGLGLTLCELCTGTHMFADVFRRYRNPITPLRVISEMRSSPEIPLCIADEDLRDLLEKCLQIDPEARLTAEELLQHPFCRKSRVDFPEYGKCAEKYREWKSKGKGVDGEAGLGGSPSAARRISPEIGNSDVDQFVLDSDIPDYDSPDEDGED